MHDKKTELPSLEQPWLKYYSSEVQQAELPGCTLYEYLYSNNKDQLNRSALDYFGHHISYDVLLHQIHIAAQGFHDIGIRNGDIVTIASMHTPETIYAIYALNYIGAVVNLIYITLPVEAMCDFIRKTDSKAFLFLDLISEKIEKMDIDIPTICLPLTRSMPALTKVFASVKTKRRTCGMSYAAFTRNKDLSVSACPYEKDRPAVIVYTSGSTGAPKGVMLSNENINAVSFQYSISGMNFQDGTTYLGILPPFIGFGISVGIHLPLTLGKELIIQLKPDPEQVARFFVKKKPNFFVSGPVFVDPILSKVNGNMSYMKIFAGGGESMPADKELAVNELLAKRGSVAKYVTGYGMAELAATVCTGMNHIYKPGSVGIPLPHVMMKILDTQTGEELSYNEIGEVYIHSQSLMLGYYRAEEETAKTIFTDGHGRRWIKTGDLGYIDRDGFLFLNGRLKRIYIAKGEDGHIYKIFAQQVEETIHTVDGVSDCAVVVKKDKVREHVAVAFYCGANDPTLLPRIKSTCQRILPFHSVPVAYIHMKSLPHTSGGKIDYQQLKNTIDCHNEEEDSQ